MGIISLIISILALLGMLGGLIPCLGWTNWFVIPVAFIGLIFGIVGAVKNDIDPSGKNMSLIGIIISGIVILIASIRLILGGGII
jgi:hypothetical protein